MLAFIASRWVQPLLFRLSATDPATYVSVGVAMLVAALAASALPTLRALRADPGAIDLVLSDQTMPGMTGLDLARACRDLPGAPRVVLYTGYAEKVPRGALDASGVAALVRKPIDPPALFATLRTHLRDQ